MIRIASTCVVSEGNDPPGSPAFSASCPSSPGISLCTVNREEHAGERGDGINLARQYLLRSHEGSESMI